MVPARAVPDGPPLAEPLRAHWLGAIAAEERAVASARGTEALPRADAAGRLDRLTRERAWVHCFRWPPGYTPSEDCHIG